MASGSKNTGIYDQRLDYSSCGVGFLTRKDGKQTHEILKLANEALCAVPHRGGMSSEGVGDGAGVSIDLSLAFFSKLTGQNLKQGEFAVGNFFLPSDEKRHGKAIAIVNDTLSQYGLALLLTRNVPIASSNISVRSSKRQLPIKQFVFENSAGLSAVKFDRLVYQVMQDIEAIAYTDPTLDGFYPVSLSAKLQVLKGRLNSWEIIPYFSDLCDPDHAVHTLYFHTRFSTNTDPHPAMAQPFRLIAHNGELNTDKKNRLSEATIALARNKAIVRPRGQSDSCRLDQTLNARVFEEDFDLVTAVVAMMPPAWENDKSLNPDIRAMFEYFSLFEEKNDGPAALIFGDGNVVGARLDRLGLRPLRTVETNEYLAVMSEAGQIFFEPSSVLRRGRVEAGGMIFYDHSKQRTFRTDEALQMLASKSDYRKLLGKLRINLEELKDLSDGTFCRGGVDRVEVGRAARYVGYSHNQETFKFLMDPMLQHGSEKVSAMGYGNAINALSDAEGGIAKYFSQRFAQVTNPPLDSLRESDGMTLRICLGEKPYLGKNRSKQIVIDTPILTGFEMRTLQSQGLVEVEHFSLLYRAYNDHKELNEASLITKIDEVADAVSKFAEERGGIAVLSDRLMDSTNACLPMILAISAINQKLIENGVRLKVSLVIDSGQIASSHHIACALGFGASAVYPLAVDMRAEELFGDDGCDEAMLRYRKAAEKSLMKTMGKVGLCTVESYIGGEFFEPNFLDTNDPVLAKYLPNMKTPVGGVGFSAIASSTAAWHAHMGSVIDNSDIPILGLFKERSEGAGHSYGMTAVREFVDLTEEQITFATEGEDLLIDGEADPFRLMTLREMDDAYSMNDAAYANTSFAALSDEEINSFKITPGYRTFSRNLSEERVKRPAALRDILALPADITYLDTYEEIKHEMMLFNRAGNNNFVIRGLTCKKRQDGSFNLRLSGPKAESFGRLDILAQTLVDRFKDEITGHFVTHGELNVTACGTAADYLSRIIEAPLSIPLIEVQPAAAITKCLTSGAMSHGALVATAHEAVAHGTNMVGGMSNSGEGGEHLSRYGTLRSSRIKQFASGRFGVWAGYLADPNLAEIEIKIGQGAKPGEGGQLPAAKVTVDIAAARGGTPGVELVSPPPHHDTYSIEDLGQLIHDAKAARVRVVVKLVSSEGIGTIAVGVAKAGADVINVAGNTGGTGAAAVTSQKYTGRAAEIGVAEVHQALCANGIRQKVVLRCSGAMQTGSDVIKAALLGADSFEFGTTALMMLKCVMAKNCNVKCPAGLTTNAETFDGDPRALAQYLLNLAHEVREILASLGFKSLEAARGRADLLHLLDHPSSVGQLNLRQMLFSMADLGIDNPQYVEADFSIDEALLPAFETFIQDSQQEELVLDLKEPLNNRNKSVGGQLSVDIERLLNHGVAVESKCVFQDSRGRRFLDYHTVKIVSHGAAGQSFAVFCNDGMVFDHTGTCNDGVGKGACGGQINIHSPLGGSEKDGENVLVGNFTLFGATGGRLFIEGQAGDRFAVRNSGATAVVEGVGEFCAEYMTNGTILNLGEFAKGFGNGMSGGFAYQYDPDDCLSDAISRDSVVFGDLCNDEFGIRVHADAVRQLLEWHVAATGSNKARRLLNNWHESKHSFKWIMPKALLQYQDADEILKAKSRKELHEELAIALSQHQISKFKRAWKAKRSVLNGTVPLFGVIDGSDQYELLNYYTVLEMAQLIASKRHQKQANQETLDMSVKHLVLGEDHSLMTALAKHAKSALESYDERELVALVANKRLSDFKEALAARNVTSVDSPGTYRWIIYQGEKNRTALGSIPSFDELFAQVALQNIIERMPMESVSETPLHTH